MSQSEALAFPSCLVLISASPSLDTLAAQTMTELISELTAGASLLQKSSFNPVSLSAGADLLLRFVTLQRPSIHQPFSTHKKNLVMRAKEFVHESYKCVEKIVGYASEMIKDDAVSRLARSRHAASKTCLDLTRTLRCFKSNLCDPAHLTLSLSRPLPLHQVIMTHSYSRVVTQSLLQAARQRKRFKVFVTESRPVSFLPRWLCVLARLDPPHEEARA